MTVKTPQVWNPQPIGSGVQGLATTQAAFNLADQLGDQLVDNLGNFLVTGTRIPQAKIPINWSNTGV